MKTLPFLAALLALSLPALAADPYSGRYVMTDDQNASVNISFLEENQKAMGLVGYVDKKAKLSCKFEFQATVKDGKIYSRSDTAPGCTLNIVFTPEGLDFRLDEKCLATYCKTPVPLAGGFYKKVSKTPVMR